MGVNVKYSDETFRLVGDLLSGMKGLTEQAIKLYPELSKNKVRENLAKALFMQWTECSTEEELKQKSKRLDELNIQLNLNKNDKEIKNYFTDEKKKLEHIKKR